MENLEGARTFPFVMARSPRSARIEKRVEQLIERFNYYLLTYDRRTPFDKTDQLKSHQLTIERRRELRTAYRAATDDRFCKNLYWTLQSWGIGKRASRLLPYNAFAQVIAAKADDIVKLDSVTIDDPSLDSEQTGREIWRLIEMLDLVDNESRIVSGTKTLHHLLPELVPPMDRRYTQRFFGLHNPEFQYGSGSVFTKLFTEFARVARAASANSYVGTPGCPWRTSRTKIIDNAIVGFCVAEGI